MVRALLEKAAAGSLNVPLVTRTNDPMPVNPMEFTWLTLPGMNWEWLNRLKALAMNSMLVLSVVLTVFLTVRSQLLVRGVAKVLRPAVASAPGPAWMYWALGLLAR